MEDLDFAMPDPEDDLTTSEAPETSPQQPLVVIQYRKSGSIGRLIPPLLILATALGVTYYQRGKPSPSPAIAEKSPPHLAGSATPAEKPAAPERSEPPDEPASDTKGKVAAISSQPAEPAKRTPPTPSPALVSPFEIDPSDGLLPLEHPGPPIAIAGLTPPTAPVTAPPEIPVKKDDPRPKNENEEPLPPAGENATQEEILADIKREARAQEAEQQMLAELKPKAEQAILAEALDQVHASRSPFRAELKDVLDHFKDRAGPEIERLCQQFGRTAPKEAEDLYHRGRRMLSVRLSRRDEVEFMRSCGLPETVVLDFLSHKIHQTMNTRGGPRDANEVRIWAARLLLSYPPGGVAAPIPPGTDSARPMTSAVSSAR